MTQWHFDSRKTLELGSWRCWQIMEVIFSDFKIHLPVFWTTKTKSIVAAFNLTRTDWDGFAKTIYEFDASTLKTIGAPFKHADYIRCLALSSDCSLLASSSSDNTIKLWMFESRQLLASFDIKSPMILVLSPDSRQLSYTSGDDSKIYICNIPANILASIGLEELHPVIIPVMSPIPRPLPTRDPHAHLHFLRKLFSSSRTDTVRTDKPCNPLDFPATSPLPHPLITPDKNSRSTPAPPTTQSSTINTPATPKTSLHQLPTWQPFQTDASPTIVDVPLAPGKLRYAAAGAPGPERDLIRDEDYVSPSASPSHGSHPGIDNSGQHGSGRCCFCF